MSVKPAVRILLGALIALTLATTSPARPDVSVKGLGLFGNIAMEKRLFFLRGEADAGSQGMRAVDIEDTAYIILQQLSRDGYAAPVVASHLTFADGHITSQTWSLPIENPFEDDHDIASLVAIEFECAPGNLNFYNSVDVEGVDVIDPKTVREFFLPSGVLFTRKQDLAFTEGNLNTRISHLLTRLNNKGYLAARVSERDVQVDPSTGATDVAIRVEQGRVHRVGRIHTRVLGQDGDVQKSTTADFAGDIFNAEWLRERRQELLNASYRQGYPDARIQAAQERVEDSGNTTVDITFTLIPGNKATLGAMRFEPGDLLKESILRRQVDLREGDDYNILVVEEGRRNLLSLGVFENVDIKEEILGPDTRGAVYTLTPMARRNLRLRIGYGSYERARIGLRFEQMNLWKRGHRYELDLKQSMKSSNADLTYVIPHFFDKSVTGYVRLGHEFREEISYDRTTSTFLFGATRRLRKPDIEVTAEYSLEKQDADREGVATFSTVEQATVSSLTLRGIFDKRDSALYPTSGYDASLTSKLATEYLGGNANFLKVELATSYHRYIASALYLHIALRYGAIFSEAPSWENLPFNERYFLGGENTIRGYTQGEASPRAPDGQLIGAESYILSNIELEQRILSNLSLVIFWDALVQNEDLDTIPESESLHSAGIGLRLRTPVGPIRLEYGHNIDPRPGDPDGTLHIAVGYPF